MGSSQSKSEEDVTRVQRDTSSPSYSKYGEKQSLEADRQPTDDQTKTAIPANSQQAKLDLLPDDNLHGESIVNSDIGEQMGGDAYIWLVKLLPLYIVSDEFTASLLWISKVRECQGC